MPILDNQIENALTAPSPAPVKRVALSEDERGWEVEGRVREEATEVARVARGHATHKHHTAPRWPRPEGTQGKEIPEGCAVRGYFRRGMRQPGAAGIASPVASRLPLQGQRRRQRRHDGTLAKANDGVDGAWHQVQQVKRRREASVLAKR